MKHTIKCFLHISTNSWEIGKLSIYMVDMSHVQSMNTVLVKSFDIEVDVPDDFDPRPGQIAALRTKQLKAAADFHKMNTDIIRQINELQALEMSA